MKQLVLCGSLVCAMACSGGGSPGSISGTIHGQSFPVSDAISATVTLQGGSSAAEIILADMSGLCADLSADQQPKNIKGAGIVVANASATMLSAPTAPGTFVVAATTGGTAIWNAFVDDANCQNVTADSAMGTSGTVTITSINNNAISGHFDVVLDSGDHVTGSFSPEACPAIQTALNTTTPPACI
jgi:hypothetical protein